MQGLDELIFSAMACLAADYAVVTLSSLFWLKIKRSELERISRDIYGGNND